MSFTGTLVNQLYETYLFDFSVLNLEDHIPVSFQQYGLSINDINKNDIMRYNVNVKTLTLFFAMESSELDPITEMMLS